MEKQENRRKYIKELKDVANLVKLTPEFVRGLEQHAYFKDYMSYVKDLPEQLKLIFILLELTRERSTCQAVINLLRQCGQLEAATKLKMFNTSTGPMPLIYDECLEVAMCLAPKKDLSNCYNLVKKFRGKCILINNMEEPQSPPQLADGKQIEMLGLKKETIRFKDLFQKLNFAVEVIRNVSAEELLKKLKYISDDMSLRDSEAFILMAISHGEDEKVLGYNACEVIRKMRFKQINPKDQEAAQVIDGDILPIADIISTFSEANCPYLRSKPKVFFFTCCRTTNMPPNPTTSGETIKVTPKTLSKSASVDTFVAYACSKGHETFFNPFHGYTFFGQALSHSIAQYACEESLSQIMSRTQKRLKHMYSEMETKIDLMGSFATEVTNYAMNNQLYFNPGIAE